MIFLTSTSDLIRVITSAVGQIEVHASYADNNAGVVKPTRINTANITTATTTTVIGSPLTLQERALEVLTIWNTHATVANNITVVHSDGTTVRTLYKCTLQAGEGAWITNYSPVPTIILANGSIKSNDNTNATITGGNISGVTFSSAAATITGGAISGTSITAIAGTTAVPAITITAGTLNTTPASGAVENSGTALYGTPITSERGVIQPKMWIAIQGGTRTLASQTAAQKMFASPTGGALTVAAGRRYEFECMFAISSMSASSGSFGWALIGTATFTQIQWFSQGAKLATIATGTTAATLLQTYNTTAANLALATANTAVAGFAYIWGTFVVNAGGTIIPAVSLGVSAAAVLSQETIFKCRSIDAGTVVSAGPWA